MICCERDNTVKRLKMQVFRHEIKNVPGRCRGCTPGFTGGYVFPGYGVMKGSLQVLPLRSLTLLQDR